MTLEMKKEMIRKNGWEHLVQELLGGEPSTEIEKRMAVNMVVDMKTMSREDYRKKYFGF